MRAALRRGEAERRWRSLPTQGPLEAKICDIYVKICREKPAFKYEFCRIALTVFIGEPKHVVTNYYRSTRYYFQVVCPKMTGTVIRTLLLAACSFPKKIKIYNSSYASLNDAPSLLLLSRSHINHTFTAAADKHTGIWYRSRCSVAVWLLLAACACQLSNPSRKSQRLLR